ncbi:hypothetical protein ACPCKW_22235 [Streptomyces griseoincarnatus]
MRSDTTVTRFDIWDGGSSALEVSEESYQDFVVGNLEWGEFRETGVAKWTWREDGDVTEYILIWFYANGYDERVDRERNEGNGYMAGKTVAMAYLKERTLCTCCEHDADND